MNRRQALIGGLFLCVAGAVAQEPANGVQPDRETRKDFNEKVVVSAPYQPSLGGLSKPVFRPETDDSTAKTGPMTYDIISRPLSTVYPVENIKPVKTTGEVMQIRPFNNRIRLACGYPLTPFAEADFGMGRGKKYDLGAGFRHYSTFHNLKNYSTFKAMDMINDAHVNGSIIADKFISSLALSYRQRMVNCYGLNDDARSFYEMNSVFVKGDIADFADQGRRWFQGARAVLSFKDNNRNAEDLKYDARLDYNMNFTNWSSTQSENNLSAGGTVGKQILDTRVGVDILSVSGFVHFEDNMYRDGINNGYFPDPSTDEYVRGNKIKNAWHIDFGPSVHYTYRFLELNADMVFHVFGNGAAKAPTVNASTLFQFNPVVDLKLHIVPDIFTFFVGTDGGVKRNTVDRMSLINPYLHPLLFNNFEFTRDKFSAYAGIFTNLSRHIDLTVKAGVHFMENILSFDYYRYDFSSFAEQYGYGYNDFVPVYSGNVLQVDARADLNLRWNENIVAHVDAIYHYYNRTIYYKPAFEANLNFKYRFAKENIAVYTNMRIATPVKALDRGENEVVLNRNGVYDWSVGAEYRFIPRMTCFVNINNILHQKYYIWHDYRSYGINFIAGISLDF